MNIRSFLQSLFSTFFFDKRLRWVFLSKHMNDFFNYLRELQKTLMKTKNSPESFKSSVECLSSSDAYLCCNTAYASLNELRKLFLCAPQNKRKHNLHFKLLFFTINLHFLRPNEISSYRKLNLTLTTSIYLVFFTFRSAKKTQTE